MTDIVGRLRQWPDELMNNVSMLREAADEIERLRKLLADWDIRDLIKDKQIRSLEAEIERLRESEELLRVHIEVLEERGREIERLRDALEQAVDDFGDSHCVCEETKQMCIAALEQF